ncbi:serine/threonine-protein kinase LMTK1-like isoform X2 [Stigmatopora nigra]
MQFLEEVQPYRTLQHPALLQCLAQCSEVTPYLLVMEFCPLGDLKSYVCSCRLSDSDTPEPLILQRMACDIASGLLHLHKNNFIHGDLALRNCLLTSEMSVKIGDYGLSHTLFKEDYYFTQDQIRVPLRWIAPELVDEVHGNLLVVDQTKTSNIWSLGVTLWELLELGQQPYGQYSDRQVLTYAVREQQLKLGQPQLQFPLSERWYEVMQFCWLQPDLRPSGEEVHLLLTYLCAKGSSDAEEDFEERWNALKPNLLGSPAHPAQPPVLTPPRPQETEPTASSSFPLLEHFSDNFHSDAGDDLLTVTETSHGLNFEYKWEQARAQRPYCSASTSGPLGQVNPHYQDIYYSSNASECGTETSPSGDEANRPAVVPVLSARSPSVGGEYYIRIEDQSECNGHFDDNIGDFSPQTSNLSPESQSRVHPNPYWSTANPAPSTIYDSDSSPGAKLTTDPLFGQAPSPNGLSELENSDTPPSGTPLQAGIGPGFVTCDPYLECSDTDDAHSNATGKTPPIVDHVSIDVETESGLEEVTNWSLNRSANNNVLHFGNGNRDKRDNYLDFDYNMHSTEMWSLTKDTTKTFCSSRTCKEEPCNDAGKLDRLGSYIQLSHPDAEDAEQFFLRGERLYSKPKAIPDPTYTKPPSFKEPSAWNQAILEKRRTNIWEAPTPEVSSVSDAMLTYPPSRESASGIGIRNQVLVELGDYSEEDDDFNDITSSIFTDFNLDYADIREEELSPLKNFAGTPDPVDTVNLSSSVASTCDQAFSPESFNPPAQPKSLDSGYDTENNGSPEFAFKELVGTRTGGNGLVLQVATSQNLASISESRLKDTADKRTYRDSAYFSDYDNENDKSPREDTATFFGGTTKRDSYTGKQGFSRNRIKTRSAFEPESPTCHLSTPGLSVLSPFPVQMGGCLTKEAAPDFDDLVFETEDQEELGSSSDPEPSSANREASKNCHDGSNNSEDCYGVQFLQGDSTVSDYKDDESNENEATDSSVDDEEEELPDFNPAETSPDRTKPIGVNQDDFQDIDAEESDSCEASNGAAKVCSASSLLELCGEDVRAPLEEAEDEDDSDDSESDEELRTYSIREDESAEGSDEDSPTVPLVVVVSDGGMTRNLRGLLKTPTLLSQSFCEELERKKKAVSFFDDVTVFLFDQESPTGELADCSFSLEEASGDQDPTDLEMDQNISSLIESTSNMDDELEVGEPQGDSEETERGFEQKDGPALEESQSSAPESPSSSPEVSKTTARNRFMVSRFSITQVADTTTTTETPENCQKDNEDIAGLVCSPTKET